MSEERTAIDSASPAGERTGRLAAAVASSSLAAALVDVNTGRIVAASEAAARLMRAPDGLVGHALTDFGPDGPRGQFDSVRDALSLLQRGAIESYQAPRSFRRLDGTIFEGRVWVRIAEEAGRRCFMIVLTDERAGGPFAASLGFVGPPPELAVVPGLDLLTGRENEVLERLMAGSRVPQIAEQMFLAPPTVRNHLSSIYRKLGVHSQADLVALLRPLPGEGGGAAAPQ